MVFHSLKSYFQTEKDRDFYSGIGKKSEGRHAQQQLQRSHTVGEEKVSERIDQKGTWRQVERTDQSG